VDTDQARAELAARPPIAAAEAALQQAQDAVVRAVSDAAGGLDFAPDREARTGGCSGPLADLGGRETVLAGALADRAVHDSWPAVLDAARTAAGASGFTELVVKVDQPDNHSVRFVAADGAYLDLASQVSTLVRGRTGCHPQ
jgi:hypothetical protein